MDNTLTDAGSPSQSPYLGQSGESELRWMGDTCTHFLATGRQTGGAFCLVDERANLGEAVPLHRHAEDMESFYVLEGEVMFYLGDAPGTTTAAGGFVHIPAGTVHGFRVTSQPARYLILTTAHHGEFYRAITLPSRPGNLPPVEGIAGATIKKAASDYGIEFIGPLPEA